MATSSPQPRRSGTLALEAKLIDCAAQQLGLFTTRQALAAGVSDSALRLGTLVGIITSVHVGVYRLSSVRATPNQRFLAACLAVPGSILSGLSAAAVHGLPIGASGLPGSPTVLVPHSISLRHDRIDVRRTRNLPSSQEWRSVRICTVASTLMAIAGLVPSSTLARCLDHAIAHRLLSIKGLSDEVKARPTSRFVGRSILLEEINARFNGAVVHRSRIEQRVGRWLDAAGLPRALSNYRVLVGGGADIEVDFAWPEFRVALEVSPFFTHGSAATQRRDLERRRLLLQAGWRIVEVTDEHLVDRESFAATTEILRVLLGVGGNSVAGPRKSHPLGR